MKNIFLILKNKILIKQYPFLTPRDYFGNPLSNCTYNELDISIPRGWWKRFGLAWCRDLKECCEKEGIGCADVYIIQAKEKFGGLRVYLNNEPECWSEHEYAWEYISEHTCIICGKFPCEKVATSWVSPFCKKCESKNFPVQDLYTIKNSPLEEFISYSKWEGEKKVEHLIDMKPYYEKIGYKFVKGEKHV